MKEYFLSCWHLILLSFGMGVAAAPAARAADITFNVNLHYQIQQGSFTPGTDAVVVFGSFSSGGVSLSDPDGDKIYSGTVTGQTADALLTYNYRISRGGSPNPETVAARRYVVQPTSAANVLADWYNDAVPTYPYARFYASSVKVIPGELVRFTDASEGGAATSWNWSFPGGTLTSSTSASSQNPVVTWSTTGTYNVTLTATNSSGNTTSKNLSVQVVSVDDRLGWWNDAVFYQIYPRSFFDTNGDGKGDLSGMTQKLDYLSNLGVTALYVMPVNDASQPEYGGYQVKDYKSIIGEIGSSADFDAFVTAAHGKGLKVILDMVFNHSSDEHPWFQSSAQGAGGKYDDYYVWRSDNPGSAWRNNTIGHSNQNFNVYWGKYGVKTPDLNYNSRSVRNTTRDVSSYWLGRSVDGFRLDAPMFLYERGDAINLSDQRSLPQTYAYWREWQQHIKAANPNSFSVGETWLFDPVSGPQPSTAAEASRYTYQGFDIGFQFDIAYGVQYALNNENKSYLQTPVEESMSYYPFLQFGNFVSNHDLYTDNSYKALRLKSRLTNNQDAKTKVAAAWLLTAPGVPFVYYGDEVGGGGNNNYARDPMRWTNGANGGFTTGNPWEPAGDFATYNVASEQNDAGSHLNLYKSLISVRKAQLALRRGGYKTVTTSSNGVYAFARTYGAETIFVVLNLAASAQNNVALSVSGTAVPNGTYPLTNLLNASQTAASVTFSGGSVSNWVPFSTIPANGFYVLKLNNGSSGPNAAPTLAAIANQTLNLEDGAKAVALTGVTDGDYCAQTLTGSASSSNPGVVSGASVGSISCSASTATLTLTPAAAGTSTVTVTLTDNGGTASGGVNTTSRSFTATVTDLPKAPTNLALSQASPTSVNVGWTDNSGRETGYRIYWSTGSTKPTTANATVGASATSYTATGLSTQTTYNFWVEAYNANGSSAAITGSLALTLPNLALNKPATASNVETYQGVTYAAAMAVDGVDQSFTNRWSAPVTSAGANQTEWIRVDLGASYNLSKVVISWENANADSYYIMASNSNVTPDPANSAWTKVNYTGLANQSRTDNQTLSLTGRYLAIYCYHKSQQYGYSIYELQAYGLAATGNQAPNASAGPNQTLPYTATSTTLDASGSSDPEGSALTYSWSKVSGNAVTFSSTAAARPTVSGLAVGSYVFQVSVSDGSLSSTAQVTVTVQANQAPVANAGPDQSLAVGTTSATLTAASSSDPEGKALTYSWSQVSGNAATFSSTTAVSPTVSGLAAGTYVFQVSVSDGALSATDQVQVTVASSSGATSYYIINRWKGTYLVDNGSSQVAYAAATTSNAAKWTLEPVGSYVRIRNVASGNYMNIENQGANVQCTNVPSSFTSSQWAQEAVSGTSYYRIRNNWQPGSYIHVENQTGFAQYGSVDVSFYSGHWTFQPTTAARSAGAPLATTAAGSPASLEVFPNPVTAGRLTVQVPGPAATARLRLYDAQGRLVLSQEAPLNAGQAELSTGRCSAGLYLLQVEAGGTTYAQKLLVQ